MYRYIKSSHYILKIFTFYFSIIPQKSGENFPNKPIYFTPSPKFRLVEPWDQMKQVTPIMFVSIHENLVKIEKNTIWGPQRFSNRKIELLVPYVPCLHGPQEKGNWLQLPALTLKVCDQFIREIKLIKPHLGRQALRTENNFKQSLALCQASF